MLFVGVWGKYTVKKVAANLGDQITYQGILFFRKPGDLDNDFQQSFAQGNQLWCVKNGLEVKAGQGLKGQNLYNTAVRILRISCEKTALPQ